MQGPPPYTTFNSFSITAGVSGYAGSPPPSPNHGIYASAQAVIGQSASVSPIALPARSNTLSRQSSGALQIRTAGEVLLNRLTERDDMFRALKGSPNYHTAFNPVLVQFEQLSDRDVPTNIASFYAKRVMAICQAMLNNPNFYHYSMVVSQANEIKYQENQDSTFIYSQAIKCLLFFEWAQMVHQPITPTMAYQDLIDLGKRVQTWRELIKHIDRHEDIQPLKQGQSFGKRCQLDLSLLYEVQTAQEKNACLLLPSFTIAPIDDLVSIDPAIVQKVIASVREKTDNLVLLYQHFYHMPFWQKYMMEYLQDVTVQGTALERACDLMANLRAVPVPSSPRTDTRGGKVLLGNDPLLLTHKTLKSIFINALCEMTHQGHA